ncbi:MAG: hypothetical protein IJR95_06600, partial [Lachnospiraceae bacterium]|nr:hypothetical protein [Lachnospiraceae bacterium]
AVISRAYERGGLFESLLLRKPSGIQGKGGDAMNVSFGDLIQLGLLIVAIIALCIAHKNR